MPYRSGVELRADGLLLRKPNTSDIDAVAAACVDPEISRFIPYVPSPYTRADAEMWLSALERSWEEESGERTFAILDEQRDPALQGVVTVRLRESGTVGYWLAPWGRGRGVMTAAVRAVVAWARETHGVSRLLLTTHPENLASQRVAERAGFARIGTTEHQPPFRDGVTTVDLFELK
jgi:RimJ/RimL family protein N-acetyltransferase